MVVVDVKSERKVALPCMRVLRILFLSHVYDALAICSFVLNGREKRIEKKSGFEEVCFNFVVFVFCFCYSVCLKRKGGGKGMQPVHLSKKKER